MTLSVREWQKNKARTLMGETVSKALKDVETAARKVDASGNTLIQLKDLTALSGSIKSLRGEIAKTKAKCSPKIHAETIKRLDAMDFDAKGRYNDLQLVQTDFLRFRDEYTKIRDSAVQALGAVVKSPTTPALEKAETVLLKGADHFQKTRKTYNTDELEAIGQQMTSAILLVRDLKKVQAERTPQVANARALPATPDDLRKQLDEVRAQITKLTTPGGFIAKAQKGVIRDAVKMD